MTIRYNNMAHTKRTPMTELSKRELQVLELVSQGYSNKMIAAELVYSEETVKSQMQNILLKLEARCRAHAVALGFKKGLL